MILGDYPLDALMFGAIIIITLAVPFLSGTRPVNLWKLYFFFIMLLCLTLVAGLFINKYLAVLAAAVLSIAAVYRQNIIFHNITEIIMPGGIIVVFLPLLDMLGLFTVAVSAGFLIFLSIFDAILVLREESGKEFAMFLSKSQVAAGPVIPVKKGEGAYSAMLSGRNSFIGLSDLIAPLFFTSTVFKELAWGGTVGLAFLKVIIIPVCAALALFLLAAKGERRTFYPAMPFLTSGCFLGYGILWLAGMV